MNCFIACVQEDSYARLICNYDFISGHGIQCTKSTCTVRSRRETECHAVGSRGAIGRDEYHVYEALPLPTENSRNEHTRPTNGQLHS